jgi:hypothetical protein
MRTYATRAAANGYNALSLDLVDLSNFSSGCGVWVNRTWVPRFTGQSIDPAWATAVVRWLEAAHAYVHSMSKPLQLGLNTVPEFSPFGDPNMDAVIAHGDFIHDESSFTNYGNSFANFHKVESILQWMAYVQNLNKPFIVDDKWNVSRLSQQQLDWGLSTYLLGKGHFAAVFIDQLPGYGREYWHNEYAAPIGHPCASYYADRTHSGVFYRKYSGAFVAVNANTIQFRVSLPKGSYVDVHGHTITSPMTLNGDTGMVLMTTSGCL